MSPTRAGSDEGDSRRPHARAALLLLAHASLLLLILGFGGSPALAQACGGENQRACCILEPRRNQIGGACEGHLLETTAIELSPCGAAACGCSNSWCVLKAPCGGPGERACCVGALDSNPSGACDAGLIETAGCSDRGDCICGQLLVPIYSSGRCVPATVCGGIGQRACCFGLEGAACNSNLSEVEGCQGDCTCGGPASTGQRSSSMCIDPTLASADPSTNWQPTTAPACPLLGYADLHVHLMADEAHGGGVLAGKPTGHITEALSTSGDAALHNPDHPLTNLFGPEDPVGNGTEDGAQSNHGIPALSGWPAWTSTTHQQVYYKWLERAYRGGLRLMVMLAVTNEALCRGTTPTADEEQKCGSSMPSVLAQIEHAKEFEAYIDSQSGGPGLGWFKIVTTPDQARREIAAGNLAVVLGVEVDNLFNCKKNGSCTPELVTNNVRFLRGLGVRHIFPIHNFDNAFGGAAIFQDAINVGNRVSEGEFYTPEKCSVIATRTYTTPTDFDTEYGFRLNQLTAWIINIAGFGNFGIPPTTGPGEPSCNSRGLTPLGVHLVTELMNEKMIIDVDHMSVNALGATVGMAQGRSYPLVASHVIPFDLNRKRYRHERMRTGGQLQMIRNLGGMIAVMTKDDLQDSGQKFEKTNLPYVPPAESGQPTIADDCRHSSKTFAQAYQYAVNTMGGPVAFGSDFNGIAAHVGPRFGSSACGLRHENSGEHPELVDERGKQLEAANPLAYPFTLEGFGTFSKQRSGQRDFDFNTDGLAHIGLLPDLIADMRQIGLSDEDLEPLFASAEAYVRMWERIEGVAPPAAPPADCVDRRVDADDQCMATASIAGPSLSTDGSVVLTQDAPGPYRAGRHVVDLTVTPALSCEGSTSCTASVEVVDRTPPPITCPADVSAECEGEVTSVALQDPVLGADNCGAAIFEGCSHSAFRLGTNEVACSASDPSDNGSECSFEVAVRDTTTPVLTLPPNLSGVECTSPAGAAPALGETTATDRCDPSPVVQSEAPPVLPRGLNTVTWTARDASGNAISAAQTVEVVDTTPPSIRCPEPVTAECTGDGKATVSPGAASGSDVCGAVDLTTHAAAPFPLGTKQLSYVATDRAGLTARCESDVTVVDRTPPAIGCPEPATVECTTNHSAPFTPAPATASDVCAGVTIANPAAGVFPSGTTPLAYSATDGVGLGASCSSSVTVGDTTPPSITALTVAPTYLWPPNHKLVAVTLSVTASDRCDPAAPACRLTAIRSNEPLNGLGDGDTAPDWQITGPLTAKLRSERAGLHTDGTAPDLSRPGRVYTLEMTCTDDAGNSAPRTTTVIVPHDQRKKK